MAEPLPVSALSGRIQAGDHGAPAGSEPGITLREHPASAILLMDGAPDAAEFERRLAPLGEVERPVARRAFRAGAIECLWSGPGKWHVVAEDTEPAQLRERLEAALADTGATLTDLSHGRVRLTLSGPAARDLLAKGCPLDVDELAPGECPTSLLGPFTVQIHCRAANAFDLYVARSFAVSLWEWLYDGALEFGGRVLARG